MRNNLDRFIKAQEYDYKQALSEIREGFKRSHWMWYIFPQIQGLGYSDMAIYYAIENTEEAKDYINHPILGKRLIEISEALLEIESNDAEDVMGYPDDLKLKSSMTLFSKVSDNKVFQKVLDKFFNGQLDEATIEKLTKI